MRSEGFPFIVGVWDWTCVRVVLVVSSSCRRRVVVVAASLLSLHWAVHTHCDTILSFKVWKVEEVSRETLVLALPSHKMGGRFRVLRDRRNTYKRVNPNASFFRGKRSTLWCGLSPGRGRRSVLCCGEGAFSTSRIVRDAQTWHYFKYRGRCSIWWVSWKVEEASQKSYLWNLKEVSHEMLVLALQTFKVRCHFRILRGRRKILEASCLKSWRSLARNAHFESFLLEKLRTPRTKCSFWKLARTARFESLLLEKLRMPRTNSFSTLLTWKVEEASHEMLVLEACCLKSWGFGSFCNTLQYGGILDGRFVVRSNRRTFRSLTSDNMQSWKAE